MSRIHVHQNYKAAKLIVILPPLSTPVFTGGILPYHYQNSYLVWKETNFASSPPLCLRHYPSIVLAILKGTSEKT